MPPTADRAPRNRTISLNKQEAQSYAKKLLAIDQSVSFEQIKNRTIVGDIVDIHAHLPDSFVDLLFVDPPYNLTKTFNGRRFKKSSFESYASYLDSWLAPLVKTLKKTATIYICSDWGSSTAVQLVAEKYFHVRNRITWEREKGRGALRNWKNCSEDIWFCTMSDDFTFDSNAVKLKRKVIAPYTENNQPKDWQRTTNGNFRLTFSSNLWTDISVPFWSMPENTDHPTQKPEKLLAKAILASTKPGDVVFDPFLGSGTTSVVAKKLNRNFVGVEVDEHYCCLAEKRLALADQDQSIQGYQDGVFWERNTAMQRSSAQTAKSRSRASMVGERTIL